jgi:hypothetical protein
MVAPREVRWVIGTRSAVLARLAVGGVWAYQGVWCKLLGRDAAQRRIVAGLPGVGPARSRAALAAVGAGEAALAAWVVAGRGRRCAAAVQTVAVAAMNAAGLRLARAEVPRPWRLLARNAAFLALAWAAAGDARG